MQPFFLALLFLSAFLHAVWNLLLKQSEDKLVATAWALLLGTLAFSPTLFVFQPIPMQVWPFLALSVMFELLYFRLLAAGYRDGEFSMVYPVARGTAPALVALWSWSAGVDQPSWLGALGLAIVVSGLLIVGGGRITQWRALRLPLGVAVCISACTLIDAVAVRQCAAAPYTVAALGLTALCQLPRKGFRWRYAAIGVLMLGSYMLSLYVYTFTAVAYATAIREVSVVIGALLGYFILGEPLGRRRLLGSAVLFIGIVLLAMVR